MPDRVAVVGGTGDLGYPLAVRWAQAGIDVVIGSRALTPTTSPSSSRRAGGRLASGGSDRYPGAAVAHDRRSDTGVRERLLLQGLGQPAYGARLVADLAREVARRQVRQREQANVRLPRDERRFPTATGKANFTAAPVEYPDLPEGRLLLQTLRSHDQYNTTIYGLDDRYRGIKNGRRVVLVNPDDARALGLADGSYTDLVSEWQDGVERRAPGFRVVHYPTARGCAAAYYPETNVLVPLDATADTVLRGLAPSRADP